MRRLSSRSLRVLIWLAVPVLLWLALRRVPLADIWATLRRLSPTEILALLAVNMVVVLIFSGRWWIILRGLGHALPYARISAYRLAAFAVSYFTPGPQFGGEPLQAYLLHRRHQVRGSAAAASIALEKAIELLANFGFLALGVYVITRLGLLPEGVEAPLGLASLGLLALPVSFLALAWLGQRPLSSLLRRAARLTPGSVRLARLAQAGAEVEAQISDFCRRRPVTMLGALAFSALSWLMLLVEYWLALRFLGVDLGLTQTLAVVTAARLAFLTPLPGGLGALEASQVIALSALGYSPAEGASMGLLIRARDLAFGGVGLLIGARALQGVGNGPAGEVGAAPTETSLL